MRASSLRFVRAIQGCLPLINIRDVRCQRRKCVTPPRSNIPVTLPVLRCFREAPQPISSDASKHKGGITAVSQKAHKCGVSRIVGQRRGKRVHREIRGSPGRLLQPPSRKDRGSSTVNASRRSDKGLSGRPRRGTDYSRHEYQGTEISPRDGSITRYIPGCFRCEQRHGAARGERGAAGIRGRKKDRRKRRGR